MWDLTRLAITLIKTMNTTLSIKNLMDRGMDRGTDRKKNTEMKVYWQVESKYKTKSYPIQDFNSNKRCTKDVKFLPVIKDIKI